MHITAGVYVNDWEEGLIQDFQTWLEKLAPAGLDYRHHHTGEDNADAHLKRTIMGHQVWCRSPPASSISDRGSRSSTPNSTERQKRVVVKVDWDSVAIEDLSRAAGRERRRRDSRRGRVLLVKRGQPPLQGRWSLPGGVVELGETLEVRSPARWSEETGLDVEVGPVVEVLERIQRAGDGRVEYHYVIIDYRLPPHAEARWRAAPTLPTPAGSRSSASTRTNRRRPWQRSFGKRLPCRRNAF